MTLMYTGLRSKLELNIMATQLSFDIKPLLPFELKIGETCLIDFSDKGSSTKRVAIVDEKVMSRLGDFFKKWNGVEPEFEKHGRKALSKLLAHIPRRSTLALKFYDELKEGDVVSVGKVYIVNMGNRKVERIIFSDSKYLSTTEIKEIKETRDKLVELEHSVLKYLPTVNDSFQDVTCGLLEIVCKTDGDKKKDSIEEGLKDVRGDLIDTFKSDLKDMLSKWEGKGSFEMHVEEFLLSKKDDNHDSKETLRNCYLKGKEDEKHEYTGKAYRCEACRKWGCRDCLESDEWEARMKDDTFLCHRCFTVNQKFMDRA